MPFDPHLFQLYLVAAVILVLTPGPDTLLVLSRGLMEGRRAGFVATAGITTGNVVQAVLAAAGVSALIAASPLLFDILRYAGAAYLAWIGVKALRAAWRARGAHGHADLARPAPAGMRTVFVNALLTNLLNPKVILFYLAFVPQFVAPERGHVALQTVVYGLLLGGMGCVYQLAIAAASAGAARRLLTSRSLHAALDGVAGLLFLGFAVRLLLTERRFA